MMAMRVFAKFAGERCWRQQVTESITNQGRRHCCFARGWHSVLSMEACQGVGALQGKGQNDLISKGPNVE